MKTPWLRRIGALLLLCALTCTLLSSCQKDGVSVMTYKDSAITANMYSYWLSTSKSTYLHYYNNSVDSDDFWNSKTSDGRTFEEYIVEQVNKQVKYTLVGMQLFREYGLKIDSATTKDIENDINEKIEYMGSRAEVNSALSAFGLNIDMLKEVYIAEEKLRAVYDYLYGTNGAEALTDDQIDAYYHDKYSNIQYIVVYTDQEYAVDADGNQLYDANGYRQTRDLTEEEKQAKQDKLDQIMIDINAGDDFSEVQARYNEVDMSNYPHGFYVSPNELGTYGFTLISAVMDMQVGEVRRINDNHAAYIVRKNELPARSSFDTGDKEQMSNLSSYAVQDVYEAKFSELAKEVVVNEEELSKFSIRTASPNSYF